jgi:hypothetical protein
VFLECPGLRQFQLAKRFYPDSQEAAWHLGHPLSQLTSEVDVSLALRKSINSKQIVPVTDHLP